MSTARRADTLLKPWMLLFMVVVSGITATTHADQPQFDFFENQIRPVLAQHCYNCHSQRAKTLQGGLYVDSLAGLLQGGDSGPAIEPGEADVSLLISALKHDAFKMPPKGQLSPKVIAAFEKWIDEGAVSPESFQTNGSIESTMIDWDSALDHWAYKPLSKSPPPEVNARSWITNPIDRYVLQKLEEQGLDTPTVADDDTLIRRTFFNLLGLPPTPEQLLTYRTQLQQPDGYEKMVSDLLASPHYGERWGRHWLDVARYSDSNGADENKPYPLAWRYRNYVIKQFNQDTPYNIFVHQQIAGDLLHAPTTEIGNDQISATTFLALGVKIDAEQDPVKKRVDIIDEQIDTIGRAFLGLTVGCARCHDHKFDPFTSEDYYAMAGVLDSTELTIVTLRSDEQPVLEQRNQELEQQRQTLLSRAGVNLGQQAKLNANTYLPHVPKIVQWQNTQFDAELRIRLSDSANRPLQSIGQLTDLADGGRIQRIQAETFARGNFGIVNDGYGAGIGIISDKNGTGLQTFEHDLNVPVAGQYQLDIRYAASAARPGRLLLNGEVIKENAIGEVTGGWNPEHQKWHVAGRFSFESGNNVLRFEVANVMSHIDQIALAPVLNNESLIREAEKYDRGDFSRLNEGYGKGIGIAATSRNNELSFIEYDINATSSGPHLLQFRYAANASRPMTLFFDGDRITAEALKQVSGGWNPEHQKWFTEATVNLTKPRHTIRIETNNVSSHIDKLRLIPISTSSEVPSPTEITQQFQLNQAVLNRWVLACQRLSADTPAIATWLKKGGDIPESLLNLTEAQENGLLSGIANSAELNEEDEQVLSMISQELKQNKSRLESFKGVISMAVTEGEIRDMPIHIRGSHLQKGKVVARRSPRLLTDSTTKTFPADTSGRLQLAEAITQSENPIAARVIVNRIWRWHFGKALVRSTENFGTSGQEPTHPELLDYLSKYLIDHHWSIKTLQRHILNSSTYRMDYSFNEQAASSDPENQWYWRHAPQRLEAEAIRDALLSVSGRIDLTLGDAPFEGIATLSPSPQQLMSNRRTYENSNRRSVYLPVVRTNVYKFLTLFDFPNPAFPTGNRHTTTLPTQAMFMINSQWVSGIADSMARRILNSDLSLETQITFAYQLAYSRQPSPGETKDAMTFLRSYQDNDELIQQAAWSAFCQLLFLSNEFIYIN